MIKDSTCNAIYPVRNLYENGVVDYPDKNILIDACMNNSKDLEFEYFRAWINIGNKREIYYISMREPKYIIRPNNDLSKEIKEELYNILMNGGWEKLILEMKNGCNIECENNICLHYDRKFKSIPDYRLLSKGD